MVRWYRDRGYAFLALSDHDIAPRPGEFVAMTQPGAFVVIPAEEVSYDAVVPGKGLVPVHLNGLCLERTIQKRVFSSVPLALRHGVEQINAQPGAVAMVNHPNYRWSLSEEDLGSLTGAKGWVQVSAPSLSPRSLCEALASGNFYSSTGVLLGGISATLSRLSLTIISGGSPAGSFITEFIADGGRVVSRQVGLLPSYTLNGYERYLRARVTGPGGTKAWTQPLATHAAPGFQRADP